MPGPLVATTQRTPPCVCLPPHPPPHTHTCLPTACPKQPAATATCPAPALRALRAPRPPPPPGTTRAPLPRAPPPRRCPPSCCRCCRTASPRRCSPTCSAAWTSCAPRPPPGRSCCCVRGAGEEADGGLWVGAMWWGGGTGGRTKECQGPARCVRVLYEKVVSLEDGRQEQGSIEG